MKSAVQIAYEVRQALTPPSPAATWRRGHYRGLRDAVFILLGRACRCGTTDTRMLQIDHRHGGGTAHRKRVSGGRTYLKSILALIAAGRRRDFQLLCANCNARKRHTHKEGVR